MHAVSPNRCARLCPGKNPKGLHTDPSPVRFVRESMKTHLHDLALLGILGLTVLAAALLTGCTVEANTDNRSNNEAHGTQSGSRITINTASDSP